MKELFVRFCSDAGRVALWCVAVTLVGSVLMFHVWNQYRITEIGYEMAEVTSEHRRLLERNKKLAIEAAVIGRTERMSSVAQDQYGLQPVSPQQVRTITIADEHAVLDVE